ncbi:CDP-alcohol phosphatidyltransferase family protein [Alicyclobacillus sacchari]|uniref:CDP-alcohol phosphatidyltransferase family protein n=1 Tax=Alicyclobacillus sacchari TaxID=392010 RepID=UPI003D6664F9
MVGVAAALVALHGRLDEAALLVVLGMLLDGLDGRAARWLHAESEFGKQLDSLSDMITFGVARSWSCTRYSFGNWACWAISWLLSFRFVEPCAWRASTRRRRRVIISLGFPLRLQVACLPPWP